MVAVDRQNDASDHSVLVLEAQFIGCGHGEIPVSTACHHVGQFQAPQSTPRGLALLTDLAAQGDLAIAPSSIAGRLHIDPVEDADRHDRQIAVEDTHPARERRRRAFGDGNLVHIGKDGYRCIGFGLARRQNGDGEHGQNISHDAPGSRHTPAANVENCRRRYNRFRRPLLLTRASTPRIRRVGRRRRGGRRGGHGRGRCRP